MKGVGLHTALERLGVAASFSRPATSNDNPFSEALFRTLKYRPNYPAKPFEQIADAAMWVTAFVAWYNSKHLHSALNFVTPDQRHLGEEKQILENRHRIYVAARTKNPERWSRGIRNCRPVGEVRLNRPRQTREKMVA